MLSGVVVLTQVGRVALSTLGVPGLLPPCPVQRIRRPERLARGEVAPALATRLLWACVPGNRQRLQAAPWPLDQGLLQRRHAESVWHGRVVQCAIGAVGVDVERAIAREKGRGDARCGD